MGLKQEIASWDGSADDIGAIYTNYSQNPNFLGTLIKLFDEIPYQNACTWLLKKWVESGNKLQKAQNQGYLLFRYQY